MLALIKKDISLSLRSLLQSAVVAAIAVLAFSRLESGVAFVSVWSLMIPYSYALMTCYTEELNNGLVFCRSLPIPPSMIVWSKFVGSLSVTLASGAYVSLLGLFAIRVGWLKVGDGWLLFRAIAVPWTALFVIHGILFFLFFKYGYKRAQSVASMLPLVFLVPLILPGSTRHQISSFFTRIFGKSPDPDVVILALAAFGLVVEAVLTWCAAEVFERKDVA